MNLTDISLVREIMEENGISFKKKFGQNFLINERIPERIAEECSARSEDSILEIGPGIGTLTYQLAKRYKKVIAVEIDSDLIPILGKTLSEYNNVTVFNQDIMKLDLAKFIKENFDGENVHVCANLPYYITSPVIMKLLESKVGFGSLTLMVQKEVAARLCSKPKSAEYGALTAAVNYYGSVKRLFAVPAGCFMPKPKVDSAVIQITPYKDLPVKPIDEKMLFAVIKASFGMRRKTLLNALSSSFTEIPKTEIAKIIEECNFSPNIRGEELSVNEFCIIADKILQKNNTYII